MFKGEREIGSDEFGPKIPKPFTVNTGEDEYVEEARSKFFTDVIDFLGFTDPNVRKAFVERDSFILHHSYDKLEPVQPTDDRITFLKVRGSVVASVIEARTDFNYVRVLFSSYITEETAKGLKLISSEE